MASKAYCEQVGVKRHAAGNQGEIQYWYMRTSSKNSQPNGLQSHFPAVKTAALTFAQTFICQNPTEFVRRPVQINLHIGLLQHEAFRRLAYFRKNKCDE